ncbi:MAG: acyl carrier protein [Terriglobia bacterium]
MHNVRQRLIKCFSAVFPELTPDEIVTSTAEGTGHWDSLSAVTLLAVVQEEFGVELETDGIGSCSSFSAMLERVNEAVRTSVPAGLRSQ